MQAIGGGQASAAVTLDAANRGAKVMLGGILVQFSKFLAEDRAACIAERLLSVAIVIYVVLAAEFVIRNLDDQVAAFQAIRENQKEKLASMPDEIRHEVEEASKVLRKLRAGASTGAVSLGMPAFGPPEVVA